MDKVKVMLDNEGAADLVRFIQFAMARYDKAALRLHPTASAHGMMVVALRGCVLERLKNRTIKFIVWRNPKTTPKTLSIPNEEAYALLAEWTDPLGCDAGFGLSRVRELVSALDQALA